ncbi:hypothetical protein chiPu_0016507 [Chiloscyllium punctatum]|uniref:Uncharacterized protein n=1 Tax=Chiloscyllium punctatum TaxID=137246 RepID=A0A401T5Q6_CHIPU|nr:hypothetical protein [Chiloscyllium punctatum]
MVTLPRLRAQAQAKVKVSNTQTKYTEAREIEEQRMKTIEGEKNFDSMLVLGLTSGLPNLTVYDLSVIL